MQVLLLASSYLNHLEISIKACSILILVRHSIELLYAELISPLNEELGHNRVKLWVGTFTLAYQYYVKLEIINSNFSNYSRVPIMLVSIIFTVYGIVRL